MRPSVHHGPHPAGMLRLLGTTACLLVALLVIHTPALADCIDYGEHIRWVSSLTTPGFARDVAVSGTRAYVTDGFPTNTRRGLHVIDVSVPSSPVVIGGVETDYSLGQVAVAGNYAFATAGYAGMIVIDISLPPAVATAIEIPGGASDVCIAGDFAYVASGQSGLHTVDISSPTAPVLMGTLDTPGQARGVAVEGTLAYVADEHQGIEIIDVSDPARPVLLGAADTPGLARGVAVSGSLVSVADDGGLAVIDASDPRAPLLVGWADVPGPCRHVAVSGGLAYVSYGYPGGMDVFDLGDPDNPTRIGRAGISGAGQGIVVSDGIAYLTDSSIAIGGLHLFDIAESTSEPPLGRFETSWRPTAVAVDTIHACVASEYGLTVVDVADPGSPSEIGNVLGTLPATDVVISGQLAYLTEAYYPPPGNSSGVTSQLRVIDISRPESPVSRGSISTPYYASHLAVDPPFAYVADYPGLFVIDVSDPSSPELAGSVDAEIANDVAIARPFAFIAGSRFGVVDVSDPTAPRIVGSVDLWGSAVAVEGNLACVAGSDSLFTIDISDPSLPGVMGSTHLPTGSAADVEISRRVAYVALYDFGVAVIDVSEPAFPLLVGMVSTTSTVLGVAPTPQLLYAAGTFFGLEIFPAQCGYPLPVTLSGLEASPGGDGIWIRWQVHEPVFSDFEIWRANGTIPAEETYAVLETGSPIPADGPWEHLDRDVIPGESYAYKIRAMRRDGGAEFVGPVFATALAPGIVLLRAIPNPAPGDVTFQLDIPAPGVPQLRIYDLAGRCVRRLLGVPLNPGRHTSIWDGRDDRQRPVASGQYVARLTSNGGEATTTVTVLR